MTESNFKPAELKRLYASNATARATLDHFASRQQDRTEMTVDRMWELLSSEGNVLARADIIYTFRCLEETGAGRFVIGRKGHPSRFLRSVNLIELGRIAKGEDLPSSNGENVAHAAVPPASPPKSDVIPHRYVLRPDFTVTIQLPADLTPPEATRLSDYVKTLPFSI
jgi:hypothetical protein